jgi:hypothetical protein
MVRRLLPLISSVLVCLTALSATAADTNSPSTSSSAELRADVDHKREVITGADAITKKTTGGAQSVIDSPVDTKDAPAIDEGK